MKGNHIMKEKKSNISILRIVATLAVIWLHKNGTFFDNPDIFEFNVNERQFFAINFYLMCWAVPVFFMISGALLLDPLEEINYRKCFLYARRILVALCLFGPFYAVLIQLGSGQSLNFVKALVAVLEGTSFGHLWYLYYILGIYLVLPAFRSFVAHVSKKELQIFLLVLFCFDFGLPIVAAAGLKTAFLIPVSWPIFYLFLGYYCNAVDKTLYKFRFLILAAYIPVVIYCACMIPMVDNKWLMNYMPIVALMAMSIFMIITRINFTESDLFWKLDRLCFSVYLIHPLIIQSTYRILKITPMKFGITWLGTVILFILFVVFTFGLSYIVSKIKPLKKYVL